MGNEVEAANDSCDDEDKKLTISQRSWRVLHKSTTNKKSVTETMGSTVDTTYTFVK